MTDQHTPDGWKLVPVEPTEAMLDVLTKAAAQTESWRYGYYNMLAAAPTPPAAAQPAASAEPECSVCGGFGEVSGESPGVACQACSGTGKAAPVAAQASGQAQDAEDAARYRWLRSDRARVANVIDREYAPGYWEYRCGEELDAAIDAARAAGGEQA